MSKNKNPLSYTSFPRIAIIKGTGIRDKNIRHKKTKIYENYLSEKKI
jgi:mevalonate pyrophosphate decarboxylase